MVNDKLYAEYIEALAIKAASKLIDEALACGIIEDQYEAQAQFCTMVDSFRERDEYYLKSVLLNGLDVVYGPGFQHQEREEIL